MVLEGKDEKMGVNVDFSITGLVIPRTNEWGRRSAFSFTSAAADDNEEDKLWDVLPSAKPARFRSALLYRKTDLGSQYN